MSEPGAESREGAAASESDEASFLDRQVIPVLREITLLPIWLVVAGHVIAFVAPALLLGIRDLRFAAQAALLIMVFGSGSLIRAEIRERGGVGILTVLVIALWAASGAAAIVADHTGIF